MTRYRIWAYLLLILLIFVLIVILAGLSWQSLRGTFSIQEQLQHPDDAQPRIVHYPVFGIEYASGIRFGKTGPEGKFRYRKDKPIAFRVKELTLGKPPGKAEITQYDFPEHIRDNLTLFLYSLDADGFRQNGIQITDESIPPDYLELQLDMPAEDFKKLLHEKLTRQGAFMFRSVTGRSYPVSGLSYVSGIHSGDTDSDGGFSYQLNKDLTLQIDGSVVGTVRGKTQVSVNDLAEPARSNLRQYLLSVDDDLDPRNGITPIRFEEQIALDFSQPHEAFENELAKLLNRYERSPKLNFLPSLGINLEAPQAEADTVGQTMPFVDIFRTARPFAEFSDPEVVMDEQGWPIDIPQGSKAYTLILQSLPEGAIPFGDYTVLYDGVGSIAYDGLAKRVKIDANRDIINIDRKNSTINRLILRITESSPDDPIRNIRVVMPGGICENAPFYRVKDENECAFGRYQAFATMLEERNRIVFNPDYLRFLRNFKVLRTMNFIEASKHIPRSCYQFKDADYDDCVLQPLRWEHRSQMDDASWGGSHRTDGTDRQGVPIEVLVALSNTLKADPWFTIPHNATDEYVEEFADYVAEHLDEGLTTWLEYSNETWNGRFWAAHYVRKKGRRLELDADHNPFREGFRYYTHRAVEIFKIWETSFDTTNKPLIRIAGSYINSPDLSRNILAFENAHEHIDAIAVAPYFHACWNRSHRDCKNFIGIPSLLPEAQSVDEIFELLNNRQDPYSLPSTIRLINKHMEITNEHDIRLIAYEGGQHLAVHWQDQDYTKEQKETLHTLFENANRDQRMGEMYLKLLDAWKQAGAGLFVTFTLPQTPHRWGSWGLKNHLNQPRKEAPKYSAIIEFQEKNERCWWQGCSIARE